VAQLSEHSDKYSFGELKISSKPRLYITNCNSIASRRKAKKGLAFKKFRPLEEETSAIGMLCAKRINLEYSEYSKFLRFTIKPIADLSPRNPYYIKSLVSMQRKTLNLEIEFAC
jgi:hypothetical protein